SDLTGAGFTEEISPYMDLLTHSLGPQIGRVLYGFGQLRINLDNINLAVDKTKKVVFALKSYAYSRGENAEKMEVDLAENIDTVLTIYHNQLKYGINLTKNLAQLPPVKVYADELAQVWTNILQNGIQAMKGEGDLLVELYQEGHYAVVAIQDSGEGIPPEHQEKIFEPFFTTKKQGEGTGLGLDICKKIIEKHGGDIRLTSEPGRTRFEILLPL
ncbi:MAG: sensor histidine kinase, partial [Bacteroidota bacterium]